MFCLVGNKIKSTFDQNFNDELRAIEKIFKCGPTADFRKKPDFKCFGATKKVYSSSIHAIGGK